MASVIDGDRNISITKTVNGPRILGDFDNTNRGNRVIFQTSNVGKESGIGVISNKDATGFSSVAAYADVDINNIFYIHNQANVGVYINDGGNGWIAGSDERIKDIIEPIENASEKVSTLRAVIGKYKKDEEGTRRSFLIAQDVQKVLPEAVDVQNDEIGTLGLQYTDLIPLLVAAIKEQREEIIALKERIEKLEKV